MMTDLFSSPLALAAILGAAGGLVTLLRPSKRPRRRKEPGLKRPEATQPKASSDPMAQLAQVDWSVKRLMNAAEFQVFQRLEQIVAEAGGGRRIFSQVAMGEILRVNPRSADRSTCTSAFNRINAKRVDYLIIDRSGYPIVAIEYQGAGHYQSDAVSRDNIKREAFRLAGVPFLEVGQRGLTAGQLLDLRRALGLSAGSAAA